MQYEQRLAPIYGSRDELSARLRDCLHFAERTVTHADPAAPMWRVDLGQVSGYEKMMMEVGLLAFIASRTPDFRDDARRLAQVVREHYDSTSAIACILRHPRLAASLGTLLLVLDHFGLASAQEIAVIRKSFASAFVESTEHVPFRLLDRHWVRGIATGDGDPLEDAIRLSTACRATHPIYMSREDGYAITHTAMYATDFGARPAPATLLNPALAETIDAAIAWCLASGDYDLLAELLLTQIYLHGEMSAYGKVAWGIARRTWDRMGFLPSPSLSAEAFADHADEASRRQYAFHNMYHTVLVGGLLCLALLGRPGSPSEVPARPARGYAPSPAVGQAVADAADHLAAVLGVSRDQAAQAIASIQWSASEDVFETLVAQWSDGPAPTEIVQRMAVDGAIVLAAHTYDLAQLAAMLRIGARIGAATPTLEEGAEFLARQSLIGGAIGAGWLPGKDERHDRAEAALESARVTASLANCLAELSAGLRPSQAVQP